MFILRSMEEEGEDADDQDGDYVALTLCHVILILVMTWSRNFSSCDEVPSSGGID